MDRPQLSRRTSWGRQIVGVGVAGGAGWVVDATLLWVLDTLFGIPTSIAAATGFLASGAVNFLINRLVFRPDGVARRVQGAKYLALFLINLLIVSAAVPLLAGMLAEMAGPPGTNLIVAKIITTAALLIPNTFMYRHWVFASR